MKSIDLNNVQENNTKTTNKNLKETNKTRTKNINLIKKETDALINQSKIIRPAYVAVGERQEYVSLEDRKPSQK